MLMIHPLPRLLQAAKPFGVPHYRRRRLLFPGQFPDFRWPTPRDIVTLLTGTDGLKGETEDGDRISLPRTA